MVASRLKLSCGDKVKFNAKNKEFMEKLDTTIRENIPMGFNIRVENILDKVMLANMLKDSKAEAIKFAHKFYYKFGVKIIDKMPDYTDDNYIKDVINRAGVKADRFYNSIGSLGGGNHFIEIGKDQDGDVWLTIHTGSRNFGNLIAKYWQSVAVNEAKGVSVSIDNEVKVLIASLKKRKRSDLIQQSVKDLKQKYVSTKVQNPELATVTGDNAAGYFFDMIFAGKYAEYNREAILNQITTKLGLTYGTSVKSNHNYIDFNDMIIRKGAIGSYEGQLMVIPFNMRDGLLIVEGKSNPEWNYSAPHGAGRVLARGAAKRQLNIEDFEDDMVDVYSTSVVASVLDESPRAYKDTDMIKEAIKPTCNVIYTVKPVLSIKDKTEKKIWSKKKK